MATIDQGILFINLESIPNEYYSCANLQSHTSTTPLSILNLYSQNKSGCWLLFDSIPQWFAWVRCRSKIKAECGLWSLVHYQGWLKLSLCCLCELWLPLESYLRPFSHYANLDKIEKSWKIVFESYKRLK